MDAAKEETSVPAPTLDDREAVAPTPLELAPATPAAAPAPPAMPTPPAMPAPDAPDAREAAAPRLPPSPADLDATLTHLERLCGRLEQAESRFKQLSDECEGVLKSLVAVDRRHSTVIGSLNERLGDWYHLESKLLEESARRIEQFERGVGHEWMVLRQLHEEPLVQLKDDADQLRMACLEAARTARHRFDSVEKAYTDYATELDHRLNEWSRELLGAVNSATQRQPAALPGPSGTLAVAAPAPVEPWPLEGVAQLHHEIRTGTATAAPPASTPVHPADTPAPSAVTKRTIVLFGALVLLVAALGGYAMLRSRAPQLWPAGRAPQTAAAESAEGRGAAGVTPETSNAASGERLADAQRAAERAGTMVDILAAADLRRYALAGASATATNQPYGQVLWSRSRGLAASASRLPALPDGKVYRLWIVPDGPPVAAGVLTPDAAGRATLLVAGPLTLPPPVTIRVTLEDQNETTAPSGPVYLVRVPGA